MEPATIRRRLRALAPALALLAAGLAPPVAANEAAKPGASAIHVYKTPTCGCCDKWVDHLRAAGFRVTSENLADLSLVKQMHRVPRDLAACHTATADGYVVEGHVPAADVKRLLAERPPVLGIAVAGMPEGSPGMEGPNPEPYSVWSFGGPGGREVFARHQEAPRGPGAAR